MKKAPVFLSTFSLNVSVNTIAAETNNAYKPVTITRFPVTSTGNIRGPIPIEKPVSIIQLPIMFPIESSYCFLRMAVKLTTNSGRDVPIATTKKLMRYSEMRKTDDKLITDSITIKDPIATPMKLKTAIQK